MSRRGSHYRFNLDEIQHFHYICINHVINLRSDMESQRHKFRRPGIERNHFPSSPPSLICRFFGGMVVSVSCCSEYFYGVLGCGINVM